MLEKYWVHFIFNTIYSFLVGIKSIDIFFLFKYHMPEPEDIDSVKLLKELLFPFKCKVILMIIKCMMDYMFYFGYPESVGFTIYNSINTIFIAITSALIYTNATWKTCLIMRCPRSNASNASNISNVSGNSVNSGNTDEQQ